MVAAFTPHVVLYYCGCHHVFGFVVAVMALGVVSQVVLSDCMVSWLQSPCHVRCYGCCSCVMRYCHCMLRSDLSPTFSSSSSYTYSTPDTWDTPPPSPTVVSEFPNVVPAYPLDILPQVAPEPFSLESLMRSWPYNSYRFTSFCLYRTDTNDSKCHCQVVVSCQFQIGFGILTPVRLVLLRTYHLKQLS